MNTARPRLLCAAALALLLTSASAATGAELLAPVARKAAPGFALSDGAGSPVSLADYRGRVVLLNFWATWCHGCKQELPWFVAFEKTYGEKGLAVVGASTDKEGWTVVKPYLEKRPLNFPVVIADAELTKAYDLGSMPMTVLIDRNGHVAATHVGMVDRAACQKEIEALLREPREARP